MHVGRCIRTKVYGWLEGLLNERDKCDKGMDSQTKRHVLTLYIYYNIHNTHAMWFVSNDEK